MSTVQEVIQAAQAAKAEAEAEQAAAITRALAQALSPPIDINPFIAQRVVEDGEKALGVRLQQVFIGSVPEGHTVPSIVFEPLVVNSKTVYTLQVFIP